MTQLSVSLRFRVTRDRAAGRRPFSGEQLASHMDSERSFTRPPQLSLEMTAHASRPRAAARGPPSHRHEAASNRQSQHQADQGAVLSADDLRGGGPSLPTAAD